MKELKKLNVKLMKKGDKEMALKEPMVQLMPNDEH